MFGPLENSLRAHRFGLTEGVQWLWQDCRNFVLWRGSILWFVTGMHAPVLMETLFNGFYSFTQSNPEMGFPFEQA
jgi:hypothetical protein